MDSPHFSLLIPDFKLLFEAVPDLYLVLTPNFTIVAVSDAYSQATLTQREKILGRKIFEVFPDNPNDPTATGVSNLNSSLNRVVQNKVADTMAVQKYDIPRPLSQGGGFEERYWSPVNYPVFDKDNKVAYIIHRVEDVTEFIKLKQQGTEQNKLTEELRVKAEEMEAEIYLRAQQLQEANKQLRKSHEELEQRVQERTAELSFANSVLQKQMADLKQAEVHIREQSALLDKTQDTIIVQDLTGKILFWNKSAEELYGWTVSEAMGKNADELLYTTQLQQNLASNAANTLKNKGEWSGELNQTTKGGQEITVDSRWTLVRDDTGNPKSNLIISTDITEKKIQAAQFLRSQRMDSIGTLASGIAHDLNNVLSPILMGLYILSDKLPDPHSQRIISTMEQSAERGADMVKQVLSFARGVEGAHILLRLQPLILDLEKMLKHTFPKSINIEVILPADLATVQGDTTQLYQALMNLCVNAGDAMPKGGTLTIEAANTNVDEHYVYINPEAYSGQFVRVIVKDTGTGMPPEVGRKIFEPFFTTKEIGKGTGLGLSTSLAIIKSHKGFINVYSEVGKGTEFKLYLPVATQVPTDKIEQESSKLLNGNGELILLVDDEEAIREITKATLELYGYKVLTATDGAEGVALYATNKEQISVVIMDMMMPNLDGQTTTNILYKIDPLVKIISTSGFMANGKAAEGEAVKAFLAKPYTAKNLLKTLTQVLKS